MLEDAYVASKRPDSFTIESLGNRDTGVSPATIRIFGIIISLLLSKTKTKKKEKKQLRKDEKNKLENYKEKIIYICTISII